MIAGIEPCDEGEILIEGAVVNYMRPSERNVAMVFQSYALYPHMTVRENITFPLTTSHGRHFDRATIAKRVAEAAELVDLTDKLNRLPSQLSGGQRQRVALARSIVRHPVAFLMDEPLSNLDALLRHEMRQSLIDLHRRVGPHDIVCDTRPVRSDDDGQPHHRHGPRPYPAGGDAARSLRASGQSFRGWISSDCPR